MIPWINVYPYSDSHEINLDWLIKTVKRVEHIVDDFTALNNIKFEGLWDASKSYLAWSIVQNPAGDGFISIKAVPSNIPLTDTEYWQPVAQYDDLYAAFNNRITALETAVGDNSSGLVKDVNDLTSVVGDNSSGLVKDVNDLKEEVFRTPSYLCITDSYGTDSVGVDRLSWCTQFATAMNLTLGTDYFKYYQPGAGFADNNGQPGGAELKNFCDVLNNAIANMSDEEKAGITHIIVGGGINDWDGTDANTITGITNFDSIAKNNFVNADIYYVCCGWAIRSDIREAVLSRYAASYKKGSELGWQVYNTAYQPLQDKSHFVSDGVHPTIAGSFLIAVEIMELLKGNNSKPLDNIKYPITYGGVQKGIATLNGNTINCAIGTFGNATASSWTVTSGGTAVLAVLDCDILMGGIYANEFPCTINMKVGGTWTTKQMNAYFDQHSDYPNRATLTIHNNVEFDDSDYGSYTFSDWYISLGRVTLNAYN